MSVERTQKIVFTGHSSGGAIAILATVWYLETYYKYNSKGCSLPEPRCVTFGAPLVGDYVFKEALGRENWSRFFVNFIRKFDIVPRIMLAHRESIKQTLLHVLSLLASFPESDHHDQDQRITEFYINVMRDTSTVAYQAICALQGNVAFLETFSSFIDLSPYRPAGTFIFSTGTRLVSVNNSDAILQILFYSSQSSNEQELSLIPNQSIRDHLSYEELVHSMSMMSFDHLDLHHLPLDGENSIGSALSDLGLSTRAKQCVSAALQAEKQLVRIQKKIENTGKTLTLIEDLIKQNREPNKIGFGSVKEECLVVPLAACEVSGIELKDNPFLSEAETASAEKITQETEYILVFSCSDDLDKD